MLNAGITPIVHEFGSLGCSGDLAPLSHCALALMGEGPVRVGGEEQEAAAALAAAGITPVVLHEKEGLALINGTDGMLGMLCLALHDLRRLVTTADVAAAMSVEGLLGIDDVFAADLHALRPQPGQALSASNMWKVMTDSPIRASHDTDDCPRVQDAYSPIVIGRDHLDCGSVASPYRETEAMADGSDAIADWPLLNALVNTASGASWVSLHHGGGVGIGRSIHAGQVSIADGTPLAAEKLARVLTNDPGMGVIRHVDAGYEHADEVARERGVRIPMREDLPHRQES